MSEASLLHGLIQERITNLAAAREVYRALGPEWPPGRWAVAIELRALLTLVREARRQAEEAAASDAVWRTVMLTRPEQGDPITAAKSYHDWQACRHGVIAWACQEPECFVALPEQADSLTAGKAWTESESRLVWGDR